MAPEVPTHIAELVTLVKHVEETCVFAIHQSIRIAGVPRLFPDWQMEDGVQSHVVRMLLLLVCAAARVHQRGVAWHFANDVRGRAPNSQAREPVELSA